MATNYIMCEGEKHYPLNYVRSLLCAAVDAADANPGEGDKVIVLESKTLDGKAFKAMLRPCDATHIMFDLLYVLTKGGVMCHDCAEKHRDKVRDALTNLILSKIVGELNKPEDNPYERN